MKEKLDLKLIYLTRMRGGRFYKDTSPVVDSMGIVSPTMFASDKKFLVLESGSYLATFDTSSLPKSLLDGSETYISQLSQTNLFSTGMKLDFSFYPLTFMLKVDYPTTIEVESVLATLHYEVYEPKVKGVKK